MKFPNPYTKSDYEIIRKLYEENLKNDPSKTVTQLIRFVLGK